MLSERGEQDVESETHSNAEENHNADMDEEHDVEVDVDENGKKVLKEDEAGDEAESTQMKDEVLDKTPVVVLTADPAIDAEAELKVKDEPEEGARPQVEVCVYGHEMWLLAMM
jgi:biopolymer transport protein ExbD